MTDDLNRLINKWRERALRAEAALKEIRREADRYGLTPFKKIADIASDVLERTEL